jgi:hypothetical protein
VHLRRALLLFAIVLGLAAVAASVSRPRTESPVEGAGGGQPTATEQQAPPTAVPAPGGPPAPVQLTFFAADAGPQRIRAGQAAIVLVDVEEPGQVHIADLGLSASAEPLTPARFDVFTRATGRHPITFEPAGGGAFREQVGTLVVVE